MKNLKIESFEKYSVMTPEKLPTENTRILLYEVEKLLFKKNQHIVLSLENIESIFSVQLSSIIQVYKLLQEFQLKLILCDLSFGVVNVLEMTQMTKLMDLYITRSDFDIAAPELTIRETIPDLVFTVEIQRTSIEAIYSIKGFMSMTKGIHVLKDLIDEKLKPVLDLSNLGFIDSKALIFLADLTSQRTLTIRGASSLIEELLDEEGLSELFDIEEDDI